MFSGVAGQPGTQPGVRGAAGVQGTAQESVGQVAATGEEEASARSVHDTRRDPGTAQDHLCLLAEQYNTADMLNLCFSLSRATALATFGTKFKEF